MKFQRNVGIQICKTNISIPFLPEIFDQISSCTRQKGLRKIFAFSSAVYNVDKVQSEVEALL